MLQDEYFQKPVTEHTPVYEGKVFGFCTDLVQLADGEQPVRRDYMTHPDAVAIVAIRETAAGEEIMLVNQYRHPVRARLWEVPAGLMDINGESPLKTAERELFEEADLRAKTWHVLMDFYTSPGCSEEALRVFLARDITEVPGREQFSRSEEEAEMEIRWFPFEEVLEAIKQGRIHNPATVVGVLGAESARQKGWQDLRPADSPWMRCER